MKKPDELGDRMKFYEGMEAQRRFIPTLPIVARIDGRRFSRFTRDMQRPFDPLMSEMMFNTALYLVRETHACMAYTQSDEITLAWHSVDPKSEIFFAGRIMKMTSQLSALATLEFYRQVLEHMPLFAPRLPTFDARVWCVPNRTEGANVFLWREKDATKNSLTMAASEFYSSVELFGKKSFEKHEMLSAKGVDWNAYPTSFRRGTYIQRKTKMLKHTPEEIENLPEKHEARTNPDLLVERRVYEVLEMPPFWSVTNPEDVIFNGADPVCAQKTEN